MVQLADFTLHTADFIFSDSFSPLTEIEGSPSVINTLVMCKYMQYLVINLFNHLKL